jgi:hypothetical protein
LALIEASGWKAFPPRLPEQPIFYSGTNEEYATKIARDSSVRQSGTGFVTRFQIHTELWVPADDLAEFNNNLVGPIDVIAEFSSSDDVSN